MSAAETGAPSRHTLRFVVFTILLDSMGFGLIMPVLPRLLMRVGHLPLDAAIDADAWMSLAMAGASFIAAPLLGNLSDALGRRKVLLVALAGMAANYLVLALAGSVGMVIFGRVLTGLLSGWGDTAPFYAALALSLANFLYGLWLFPETLKSALPPVQLCPRQPVRRLENRRRFARDAPDRAGAAAVADRQSGLSADLEFPGDRAARLERRGGRLRRLCAMRQHFGCGATDGGNRDPVAGPAEPVHFPGIAFVIAALVTLAAIALLRTTPRRATGSAQATG